MLALCLALLLPLAPEASAAQALAAGEPVAALERGGHMPDGECRNCGPALHCLVAGLALAPALDPPRRAEPPAAVSERPPAALVRAPPAGSPRNLPA
jgi:hypothetical protein